MSRGQRRPPGRWESRAGDAIDRLARFVLGWWQRLYLVGLTVFVALPLLAPLLAMRGETRVSSAIYSAYRLTCHQLPHHSWFLGGAAPAYAWSEVQPYTDFGPEEAAFAFHRPLRHPELGYQLAFCQRDSAIWISLWLVSIALVWRARRTPLVPLRMRHYLILLVPMAVDGLTQLVGLRESTPFLRTLTGAVFGAATALLVVPLLDEGVREIAALEAGDSGEPAERPRRA